MKLKPKIVKAEKEIFIINKLLRYTLGFVIITYVNIYLKSNQLMLVTYQILIF